MPLRHLSLCLALLLCWFANEPAAAAHRGGAHAYLVRGIAGCGNCHTPTDPDEQPIGTMALTWAKGSIELAATGHRRRPFTALAGMHHGVARRAKSAFPNEKSAWHGFNAVPDLRR